MNFVAIFYLLVEASLQKRPEAQGLEGLLYFQYALNEDDNLNYN